MCHRVSEPQHSLMGVVSKCILRVSYCAECNLFIENFSSTTKIPNFHTSVTTVISICSGSQKIRILLPMTHELSDKYHGSEPAIGIAWNISDRTDRD